MSEAKHETKRINCSNNSIPYYHTGTALLGNALKTVGGLNVASSTTPGDEHFRGNRSVRRNRRSPWTKKHDDFEYDEDSEEDDEGEGLFRGDDGRPGRDDADGLRRCTICKGTGHDRRNCSKFVLDSRGSCLRDVRRVL